MAEEVKQALKAKASAKAGLKTTKRQAEDLRKELHHCEINLATEKQLMKDLRKEIHKVKEAAQLLKEAAETRNGNGSGSGRDFSYPDPTRGARPMARTRPV